MSAPAPGGADAARADLEASLRRFADLPPEALVKQDLLRLGLAFAPRALTGGAHKPRDYFIFSFDLVEGRELSEAERTRAPEEIRLSGGGLGLKPTVVSVRLNPASPYRVDVEEGRCGLYLGPERLADVAYQPPPAYYGRRLASGKLASEIVPAIEWGYLLYVTAFRLCQYFGRDEECAFCDINHNYRQQREMGRPYTGVKRVEDVVETLRLVAQLDTTSRAYTVTGGSITGRLDGLDEVGFYGRYAEAIETEFPGRWISKVVVQAQPREAAQRLKQAGVRILHPNYEVWDPELFRLLCPGKDRLVGRERWLAWTLEAAEVFGPEHVIPNFVAGVELARPHGFATVEEAVDSATRGLEFFMSHGICPRFTTWCPEPLTELGPQPPAPLAYYGLLLRSWRDCFEKHALPVPPGYGPPGAGHAVFSVSAFLDVVRSGGEGEPRGSRSGSEAS